MPLLMGQIKRGLHAVLMSSAFHLGFLAAVILLGTMVRTRYVETVHPRFIAQVEVAGGSHAIKVKLPESAFAAHTRKPVPDAEASKKTILPVENPPLQMAGGGSPTKPHAGDGSGQATHGIGSDSRDVRPAFPVFSPRPPVTDRSLLPTNEQKIVVDVDLNESGEVISESLVKGMGNQLDQIVLDIVKTWRFHPATIDGKPVATEAELIFPFNPDYPLTVS